MSEQTSGLTPEQSKLLDEEVEYTFVHGQTLGRRATEAALVKGMPEVNIKDRTRREAASGFNRERYERLLKQEMRNSMAWAVVGLSDDEVARQRESLLDWKSKHPVLLRDK